MLKYTICFIRKGTQILMLNRNKSPNMGLWNGVGGKIEEGELPEDSVKREIMEETGICIEEVMYTGNVTWSSVNGDGGMYVFLAEVVSDDRNFPISTREGLLEWKEIDWILDENNRGIVSNIHQFLPKMMEGIDNVEHHFVYENSRVVDYQLRELEK